MQTLYISWQRLLIEGQTCDRCGGTEAELELASRQLQEVLAPFDIQVIVNKQALNQTEFAQDPKQSNRIIIGGRPLEDWLQAGIGQSPCCGPCGDNTCRTLVLTDKVYETIPAELIIQAGLLAARQLGASPAPRCCG